MLALKFELEPDATVAQLLAQARATSLAAFAHQDVPFDRVVEALQPARSRRHSPLFQATLALNAGPTADDLRLPGLSIETRPTALATTHFDLALALQVERGAV